MTLPVSTKLQRDVAGLMARVNALEHLVFQINPHAMREQLDGLEAVRNYLRKIDIAEISPHVANFLTERLPVDWIELVRSYGYRRVFLLLSDYKSVQNAREELRGA
jgi:hypothetical protein